MMQLRRPMGAPNWHANPPPQDPGPPWRGTPPGGASPGYVPPAGGVCAPGYTWNLRTGSCLPSGTSLPPPIAPLNACPSGWTAMAPGAQPPSCSGQYQSFNLPLPDETTVTCTRCLGVSPAAPFNCPSGWSTVQIPCAPGEQPLELLHRNPDGTLAACYQCLQTPMSIAYAARAAQAAQAPAAAPPGAPPAAPDAPGGGFWSNLSTGGKVALVGGGAALIALFAMGKKGGRGGGSRIGSGRSRGPSRRTSDDDEE